MLYATKKFDPSVYVYIALSVTHLLVHFLSRRDESEYPKNTSYVQPVRLWPIKPTWSAFRLLTIKVHYLQWVAQKYSLNFNLLYYTRNAGEIYTKMFSCI